MIFHAILCCCNTVFHAVFLLSALIRTVCLLSYSLCGRCEVRLEVENLKSLSNANITDLEIASYVLAGWVLVAFQVRLVAVFLLICECFATVLRR